MQAGQNNLLQTILDARSSRKKSLSFASNSDGLQIILICSLGKSCQSLGKLYKGNKSRDVKLACVRRSWSKLRS